MPSLRAAEPPRLLRSVAIQAAALCAIALLSGLPWVSRAKEPQPAPKPMQPEKERRIRVVRIPKPEPVRTETPKPVAPPKEPPRAAPRPPPPRQAPQQMQAVARPPEPGPRPPPSAPPIAHVAAELTAVKGVPLHILVPTSPVELAAHLRNSGGCLVVSRFTGDGGDILAVLGLEGSRAVEIPGPPCGGIPRSLSVSLNAAIGDPVGRARAEYGPGDLRLQAILSPELAARAQSALVARFGPIAQEDMAQKAAASGYELTCFAEPAGAVRCQ